MVGCSGGQRDNYRRNPPCAELGSRHGSAARKGEVRRRIRVRHRREVWLDSYAVILQHDIVVVRLLASRPDDAQSLGKPASDPRSHDVIDGFRTLAAPIYQHHANTV